MATEKKTMPVFHRTFAVERGEDAEQTRMVDLSFSSEEPYERYDGVEILGHNPQEVDLSRLNNSAPLLVNHDPNDQVGVVEFAKIDGGKGRARVRFGKSARAEEIFRDVLDGIRKNVSVAYRQLARKVERVESDIETYRVTRWLPLEISTVGIPADNTVGIGRSAELSESNECTITKPDAVPEIEDAAQAANPALPGEAVADPVDGSAKAEDSTPKITTGKEEGKTMSENTVDPVKAERARVAELTAIGQHCNCNAEAVTAIAEGTDPHDFRKWVLENKFKATPAPENGSIGMNAKEIKQWSMLDGIRQIVDDGKLSGIVKEASDAVAAKCRKVARGFLVPDDVMKRDANTTAATGGYMIANVVRPPMIEALINAMIATKAGAQVITGLVGGSVLIPRKSSTATSYWTTDGVAGSEGQWTLGQLSLVPHTCTCWTEITRQLMLQSSFPVEQLVREDVMGSMASAIDLAVWYGGVSSSLNEPEGILNNTGITRTALGTTALGDVPSYADLIGMQTTVGSANGWGSKMAYVTNHSIRGLLKVTPSSTAVLGAGFIVTTENGQDYLDGYPLHLTNAIPSTIPLPSTTLGSVGSGIIYGDMSSIIVAMWTGLDIMVDPYSQSSTGKIRIVGFQDVDTNVRQTGAFVRVTDAKAATT